jgi:hypothetical protein
VKLRVGAVTANLLRLVSSNLTVRSQNASNSAHGGVCVRSAARLRSTAQYLHTTRQIWELTNVLVLC